MDGATDRLGGHTLAGLGAARLLHRRDGLTVTIGRGSELALGLGRSAHGGGHTLPRPSRAVRRRSAAIAAARSSSSSRPTLVGLELCILARYSAARSR